MKDKEARVARQVYEESVRDACNACNKTIEGARRVKLFDVKTARKSRDEAIIQAKEIYRKSKDVI